MGRQERGLRAMHGSRLSRRLLMAAYPACLHRQAGHHQKGSSRLLCSVLPVFGSAEHVQIMPALWAFCRAVS